MCTFLKYWLRHFYDVFIRINLCTEAVSLSYKVWCRQSTVRFNRSQIQTIHTACRPPLIYCDVHNQPVEEYCGLNLNCL